MKVEDPKAAAVDLANELRLDYLLSDIEYGVVTTLSTWQSHR